MSGPSRDDEGELDVKKKGRKLVLCVRRSKRRKCKEKKKEETDIKADRAAASDHSVYRVQ